MKQKELEALTEIMRRLDDIEDELNEITWKAGAYKKNADSVGRLEETSGHVRDASIIIYDVLFN